MSAHPPVQIVDDNDRPLRGGTYDEVQLNGLFHRIVRVMIIDDQDRWLLQKRNPKAFTYPGRWDDSSAGHVDEGEDYLTAALRELGEEFGIHGVELELIKKYQTKDTRDGRTYNRFNAMYVGSYGGQELRIAPGEVADTKWVTPEELKKAISKKPDQYTPGLTAALKYIK